MNSNIKQLEGYRIHVAAQKIENEGVMQDKINWEWKALPRKWPATAPSGFMDGTMYKVYLDKTCWTCTSTSSSSPTVSSSSFCWLLLWLFVFVITFCCWSDLCGVLCRPSPSNRCNKPSAKYSAMCSPGCCRCMIQPIRGPVPHFIQSRSRPSSVWPKENTYILLRLLLLLLLLLEDRVVLVLLRRHVAIRSRCRS